MSLGIILLINLLKELENIYELSGVTLFYHNTYTKDMKGDRCKSISLFYMSEIILGI